MPRPLVALFVVAGLATAAPSLAAPGRTTIRHSVEHHERYDGNRDRYHQKNFLMASRQDAHALLTGEAESLREERGAARVEIRKLRYGSRVIDGGYKTIASAKLVFLDADEPAAAR